MLKNLLINSINKFGEDKVFETIDDTFMLFISLIQTAIVAAIGLYFKIDIFHIFLAIFNVMFFIVYLYDINHYNVIRCSLFTFSIFIVTFILIQLNLSFFIPAVLLLIIVFINKAEPKNSKCYTCFENDNKQIFYFSKGKSVAKKLIRDHLAKNYKENKYKLKEIKKVNDFDYEEFARLIFELDKSKEYIITKMNITERKYYDYLHDIYVKFSDLEDLN